MKNLLVDYTEMYSLTNDELLSLDGGVKVKFRGVEIEFSGQAALDAARGFFDGLLGY